MKNNHLNFECWDYNSQFYLINFLSKWTKRTSYTKQAFQLQTFKPPEDLEVGRKMTLSKVYVMRWTIVLLLVLILTEMMAKDDNWFFS